MFASLPLILALILLFLLYLLADVSCWRKAYLSALVAWGVLLFVITEALSTFSLINRTWILAAWVVLDISLVVFLYLNDKPKEILHTIRKSIAHFKKTIRSNPFLAFSLLSIGIVLSLTALIALSSAPNTADSQIYHMSRVMHWLQNQSVNHYPTNVTRQLDLQPWSSFAILHLQALSDGDRFANLVQWGSMLGCLIGVSLIAKELGANLFGQILSTMVCLGIPIGLLQSVTTQNDYVVSLWLTCLAYQSLIILKGEITARSRLEFGASLGLALVTKATAYIYAFPFCLVWLFSLFRHSKNQPATLIKLATLSVLPALALNVNHWRRNIQVFEDPFGISGEGTKNELFTLAAVISNFLRNVSLHLATVFEPLNAFFTSLIISLHNNILSLDVNDPRTTFRSKLPFNIPIFDTDNDMIYLGEDISGNPLHVALIAISVALYFGFRRSRNHQRTIYLIALLGTVFLFCTLLRWQPWATRLQLPFFVLISPFIASVVSSIWNRSLVSYFLVFGLTLSALPYCFFSSARPLAQSSHFFLYPLTIFEHSRFEQHFITSPNMKAPYIEAMNAVLSARCYDIGLQTHIGPREYPLWVLARANSPDETVRMRSVNVENPSKDIKLSSDQNFLPCAILVLDDPKAAQKFVLSDTSHSGPVTYSRIIRNHRIHAYLRDGFSG